MYRVTVLQNKKKMNENNKRQRKNDKEKEYNRE